MSERRIPYVHLHICFIFECLIFTVCVAKSGCVLLSLGFLAALTKLYNIIMYGRDTLSSRCVLYTPCIVELPYRSTPRLRCVDISGWPHTELVNSANSDYVIYHV